MELLKSLYKINSKSGNEAAIKRYVLEQLADIDLTIEEDSFGNIFITKGVAESYPCVTAHFDEVHLPIDKNIIVEGDAIFAETQDGSAVGIGADDKNGLWIIIRLLQKRPILKAALFVQEEVGCKGSKVCSLNFFTNVPYILAVDRKGETDVVTVGKDVVLCSNDMFPVATLQKYGYECVVGGRTDVVALKERGLTIPCCNIGCGYYNAHTNEEYTIFSHLQKALSFVDELIDVL